MELNKIYNESNLDTMGRMPDNFVDLTVTSPPYDNLRTYNGYSFPFEAIAKELYRVTKQGGVVVWVVGDATVKGSETGTSFKQALYFKEIGFNLHDTMIYKKSGCGAAGSCYAYLQNFEYMFVFSKGLPGTVNLIHDRINVKSPSKKEETQSRRSKDTHTIRRIVERKKFGKRTNIWEYNTGKNLSTKDQIAFQHPAIFPEQLAQDHILSWSNENDVVYDCFMGSGTTAKMALLNNRNYIGSELSSEYCNIAEERLINSTRKQQTIAFN